MNTDYNITEIQHKNIKALVREGTSDAFVVREVFGGEYNKLNIQSNDIVLDVGLNIGMFTCWAMKKGAKEVHSYEPDLDNFNLATLNVTLNGFENTTYLYNVALVGNDDKTRDFSVNVKKNKGAHSLLAKRGRDTSTVLCENFNNIVRTVSPDVIKMDIEGGELECMRNLDVDVLRGVREFIMEFHHAHLNDIGKEVKFKEVINILENIFKHVQYRESPKGAWVSNIYCSNIESL